MKNLLLFAFLTFIIVVSCRKDDITVNTINIINDTIDNTIVDTINDTIIDPVNDTIINPVNDTIIDSIPGKVKIYPDLILAGQTSGIGIQYTDLVPDRTLHPDNVANYIDINQDGVDDFMIKIFGQTAAGFGLFASSISPLNMNELASSISANSLVDTLRMNDSINKDMNWINYDSDLYYESWSQFPEYYYSTGLWDNATNKYIGVKVIVGDAVFYGWIGLETTYPYVIKDFACTMWYEQQ